MRRALIIDYGSGNIHSASRALSKAANMAQLSCEILVSNDAGEISRADYLILPGVGHFADCAANLRRLGGLTEALEDAVIKRSVPFLGICVGMQLMADFGLEDGETRGLGWIHGRVDKIDPGPDMPVPHMGWNALQICRSHPVLEGLGEDPHVYFVHSFAFRPEEPEKIAAMTNYGEPIVAAIARDNLLGVQFHPEKSQKTGLQILANFLQWTP